MTIEHALSCKTGGIVHIRHDDMADEWKHLCATAFSPCRVECEPRIFLALVIMQELQQATPRHHHHPLLPQPLLNHPPPLRRGMMQAATGSGNAAVHASSICVQRTRMPDPIGRRNLQKFWNNTRKRRRTSTFRTVWKCGRILHQWSTLWMGSRDERNRNAEKRLATQLASKWNSEYSQVVYYVRVGMASAVVRANSLLIRGSRDRQRPHRPLIPDGAALGDWQTWQDR